MNDWDRRAFLQPNTEAGRSEWFLCELTVPELCDWHEMTEGLFSEKETKLFCQALLGML